MTGWSEAGVIGMPFRDTLTESTFRRYLVLSFQATVVSRVISFLLTTAPKRFYPKQIQKLDCLYFLHNHCWDSCESFSGICVSESCVSLKRKACLLRSGCLHSLTIALLVIGQRQNKLETHCAEKACEYFYRCEISAWLSEFISSVWTESSSVRRVQNVRLSQTGASLPAC